MGGAGGVEVGCCETGQVFFFLFSSLASGELFVRWFGWLFFLLFVYALKRGSGGEGKRG